MTAPSGTSDGFVAPIRERLHLVEGAGPEFHESEAAAAWNAPYGALEEWDLQIEDRLVPGPHGDIPVRIYRPPHQSQDRPALVWYHGGAFFAGDLDMPEAHEVARGVAGRADAVVVSVFYRLCPPPAELGGPEPQDGDVRFPVPHDDAVAALRWTHDNAEALGIDPGRITVGGASAGGNLAAGVGLRMCDEGTPPAQLVLMYPLVHPAQDAWTDEQRRDFDATPTVLQFPREVQDVLNRNYLGGDEPTPYAFAGLAPSLEGYPPTYIENAQFDSLRASGERFGQQLADAGVDVETRLVPGVPHGHLNSVGLAATHESLDAIAARVAR